MVHYIVRVFMMHKCDLHNLFSKKHHTNPGEQQHVSFKLLRV